MNGVMPADDGKTAATSSGLSAAVAAERLRQDGPNELPQDQRRHLPRIAWDAVREPMLQLLLAAGVIYLLLGNLAEALILLGFAVLNVVMVVVQESRTESALAALRALASPQALVWRDGQRVRLPAKDLVAGDMIALAEGERVPADAVLRDATALQADEALLTGESVPVGKRAGAGDLADAAPGGDDTPYVWAGSLITSGSGTALRHGDRAAHRDWPDRQIPPQRGGRRRAAAGANAPAGMVVRHRGHRRLGHPHASSMACCTDSGYRQFWPELPWPWPRCRRSFRLSSRSSSCSGHGACHSAMSWPAAPHAIEALGTRDAAVHG